MLPDGIEWYALSFVVYSCLWHRVLKFGVVCQGLFSPLSPAPVHNAMRQVPTKSLQRKEGTSSTCIFNSKSRVEHNRAVSKYCWKPPSTHRESDVDCLSKIMFLDHRTPIGRRGPKLLWLLWAEFSESRLSPLPALALALPVRLRLFIGPLGG